MFVRQRAVPVGIGVDLRAIQRHRAKLQHSHLHRHAQYLHEQRLDLRQKTPPERGNSVVVWMIVGRNKAERHRIIRCPLQLAAGKHPSRIPINNEAKQQLRMVRRLARATIAPGHRTQIKPRHHLNHKPSQMTLRQPLIHRRRHQKAGVTINQAEIAHAHYVQGEGTAIPKLYQTIPRRVKSDSLLEHQTEVHVCCRFSDPLSLWHSCQQAGLLSKSDPAGADFLILTNGSLPAPQVTIGNAPPARKRRWPPTKCAPTHWPQKASPTTVFSDRCPLQRRSSCPVHLADRHNTKFREGIDL